MERSFAHEIKSLSLGASDTFHGEGILAVTKALLQSGVSYVGGYQGAPVSHLIDVLGEARELLDGLGIYFENCASEAGAAAMLGASIHYPVRGAVTWKSTVGTNVASDALSNLASAGVVGGVLVVLGEDYGEGSSIIQERSHAFAMKSQVWLMDPRPDLPSIVRAVEASFALSEASQTPVMMQLRIRACHLHGSFVCKDNRRPAYSIHAPLPAPAFDFGKVNLPPSTYAHERSKTVDRWPAAVAFIRDAGLNESFTGDVSQVGIIVQGGLYNGAVRALQELGLADAFGASRIPLHVLNVVYPLVPDELLDFCAHKQAILVVEEGQPSYLEDALASLLYKAGASARLHGKDLLALAGEYTGEVLLTGIDAFVALHAPGLVSAAPGGSANEFASRKADNARALQTAIAPRPPGFCTGCPERPVFSAIKIAQRELGPIHVSADIGCHTFGSLPPFNLGSTVMGYGLGLAGASGIAPLMQGRTVSLMGDGGFWHNGLTSGIVNAVHNAHDGVLVIFKNGYTSATGTQAIPSSPVTARGSPVPMDIATVLRAAGVSWIRTVPSFDLSRMAATFRSAMATPQTGLKVIIADGECQLEKQRRVRPLQQQLLQAGKRVVRTRFGIDEAVCTGDHSCIRLSGCPSLTIKDNPSPLRTDPVATVNQGCVGCGLCGEVAHAAILCPSFYKASVIHNPNAWDRFMHRVRTAAIGMLALIQRPVTILISALGGEGGAVLAGWIIDAARSLDFPVQSTSVPGVAQRTGATTYYLEIFPVPRSALGGREPVFALTPTPGRVDLVAASELLEAGRVVQGGFASPERTTLVASTHREYAYAEKMAMGDGRHDSRRLIAGAFAASRQCRLADLRSLAWKHGTVINTVLLGAMLASGALPLTVQACEAAIRTVGKGVDASLKGLHAGLQAQWLTSQLAGTEKGGAGVTAGGHGMDTLPADACELVSHGVALTRDYQDEAYAQAYLSRVRTLYEAERHWHNDFAATREAARYLALWMSFEDTIRVADLKTRPERLAQVRTEVGAGPHEPVALTEYLKPGLEELCSILPAGLAAHVHRALARWAPALNIGLHVRTHTVTGFLMLCGLRSLRRWRRHTSRYASEQRRIDSWLAAVLGALRTHPGLALELALCGNLVKGYGDTAARGHRNLETILKESLSMAQSEPTALAAHIAQARKAALADPHGHALARALGQQLSPEQYPLRFIRGAARTG